MAAGHVKIRPGLDFKQCSLGHTTRALRSGRLADFISPSASPACSCPLSLSASGQPASPGTLPECHPGSGDTVSNNPTHSTRRSGRPGRLPASAPLGSGHAQLRHPALRATNSPATSRPRPGIAIRRRHVEMVSRLGIPGIYPSGGLVARHPLPSAGSRGSVPPLQRYYEVLRIPSTRPAALRCLRLAVSRSHPLFAPSAAGCTGQGQELVTRCSRRDLPRR
jgi:hypothetical protein